MTPDLIIIVETETGLAVQTEDLRLATALKPKATKF